MAQKREKEETELKVPETLICTAPIPVPPKPSAADDSDLKSSKPPEISDPPPDPSILTRSSSAASPGRTDLTRTPHTLGTGELKRREVNRCASCRRKVGLTGFRCRCGDLFCTEHRYSDRHDCSYDYKAAGREAIARENPVVRPTKILKV